VAELVLHEIEVARLVPTAFPCGVVLAGAGSALMIHRRLRGVTGKAAWRRAILWPSVVAALVGAAVDWFMHSQNGGLALSFAGYQFSGGLYELVEVSAFAASAGLLGTFIVWVINLLCVWVQSHPVPAQRAARGAQAAGIVWVVAFAMSVAARACATDAERATSRVVVGISAVALLGLALRAAKAAVDHRRAKKRTGVAALVYRQSAQPTEPSLRP
jgi:hypothetical protein